MKCALLRPFMRSLTFAALLVLAGVAFPAPASADDLNCLISRGNLCFHTGSDNRGKSQRIELNFGAGNFRF